MTKKTLLTMCFVAVALMAAGSASASTTISTSSVTIGGGAFAPSNSVKINVDSATANYAAFSGHQSGNRTFFTNNADPKLYFGTRAAGTHFTDAATATMAAPSGWSTL
jgi:hypothetical protein